MTQQQRRNRIEVAVLTAAFAAFVAGVRGGTFGTV